MLNPSLTFSSDHQLRTASEFDSATRYTAKKIATAGFEWPPAYKPTMGLPNVSFDDVVHVVTLCLHHDNLDYVAWQLVNQRYDLMAQYRVGLNTTGGFTEYSKYAKPERVLVRGPVHRVKIIVKAKSESVSDSYRHLIRCPEIYQHRDSFKRSNFTTIPSQFAAKISGNRLAGAVSVSNTHRIKMQVVSAGGRYALAQGVNIPKLSKILILPQHVVGRSSLYVGDILSGIVVSDGVEKRWDRNRGEHRLQARSVTVA